LSGNGNECKPLLAGAAKEFATFASCQDFEAPFIAGYTISKFSASLLEDADPE
jgi:hypothetical protein